MGNDGYGNTKLYASAEHGATGDDDDNDDEDDDDDDEDDDDDGDNDDDTISILWQQVSAKPKEYASWITGGSAKTNPQWYKSTTLQLYRSPKQIHNGINKTNPQSTLAVPKQIHIGITDHNTPSYTFLCF